MLVITYKNGLNYQNYFLSLNQGLVSIILSSFENFHFNRSLKYKVFVLQENLEGVAKFINEKVCVDLYVN